jgi:uncharacterized protein
MMITETESHTDRSGSRRPGDISLPIFLALSLALSWTIWLWPLEYQGSFYLVLARWRFQVPFDLTKLTIGVCAPGVLALTWSLLQDKDEFRNIVRSLVRWRVSFRWYLIAVALPWVVFWASLAVTLFYFPSTKPRPSLTWFALNLLLLIPFGPLWEEVAWRSFALRHLQKRFRELTSSLILGVFWGFWHIPLWWITLRLGGGNAVPLLMLALVSVIGWSVVFAFVYNRSGQSLLIVVLLHAAYDSATAAIFPTIQAGQIFFIAISAGLSVLLALILGVRMRDFSAVF